MKVVLSFGGDYDNYNPIFSQATGVFGIAHLRRHLPGLEPLAKVDAGDWSEHSMKKLQELPILV